MITFLNVLCILLFNSFLQISMNAIPILVGMVEVVVIFSTCTTAHVWLGLLARIVKLVSD